MTKRAILRFTLGCAAWGGSAVGALAQLARRPFAVAGGEGGGGGAGGVTGWLMAEQSSLTHLIAAKVHALHGQSSAAWGLVGLGLAYGVAHAAGPGHGKAVLASYMLANETSLRRGAAMALMAALLQALIAIALVGAAGFIFQATALQMTQRRRLDRARELLQRRRHRRVARLAKGLSALCCVERTCGAPPRTCLHSGLLRRPMAPARLQPLGRGLPRRAARGRGRVCRRMRARARSRSGRARWAVLVEGRSWNGDRRGRAALLGRDPGARVRDGAGAVRGWSCGRSRDGDRHGCDDRSARLGGRLRQVDRDASCGGGKFAPCARREGISNSPPRSRCWRSASRSCSARAASRDDGERQKSRPEGGFPSPKMAAGEAASCGTCDRLSVTRRDGGLLRDAR